MTRDFEAVVVSWLARRAPNTRAAYRSDLTAFATWCDAAGRMPLRVSSGDIETFAAWSAASGLSRATIARRLSAINSFFAHAQAQGDVERRPAVARAPRTGDASPTAELTEREERQLVRASQELGHRTMALVGLLLFDGFKLNEVLAAGAADIAHRPPTVSLRVERRGARVSVELDPRTAVALVRYLGPRRTGPLLRGDSAARPEGTLTRFGADYLLKRVAESAGIDRPVSANTLRRSHVVNAHQAGEAVAAIRDRLGQRDARTTKRYI